MATKLQRACRRYLLRLIGERGPDEAVRTLRALAGRDRRSIQIHPLGMFVPGVRRAENRALTDKQILALEQHSPLGRVLAAGISNRHRDRGVMTDAIEPADRHVTHELECHLNMLGTIAAISPLMGLLGTVAGMIRTFRAITVAGIGNPTAMAGGIAEALLTTAAGLMIAIPALFVYRYLRGRVDALVIQMEKESIKLVQAIDRTHFTRPLAAHETVDEDEAAVTFQLRRRRTRSQRDSQTDRHRVCTGAVLCGQSGHGS